MAKKLQVIKIAGPKQLPRKTHTTLVIRLLLLALALALAWAGHKKLPKSNAFCLPVVGKCHFPENVKRRFGSKQTKPIGIYLQKTCLSAFKKSKGHLRRLSAT